MGAPLKGGPLKGAHAREPSFNGAPFKGARLKEATTEGGSTPNALKPFCLWDPLLESIFARGPSFVGAPLFVGALGSCPSSPCLNPALVVTPFK
jgi:hypothetical protein